MLTIWSCDIYSIHIKGKNPTRGHHGLKVPTREAVLFPDSAHDEVIGGGGRNFGKAGAGSDAVVFPDSDRDDSTTGRQTGRPNYNTTPKQSVEFTRRPNINTDDNVEVIGGGGFNPGKAGAGSNAVVFPDSDHDDSTTGRQTGRPNYNTTPKQSNEFTRRPDIYEDFNEQDDVEVIDWSVFNPGKTVVGPKDR